MEPIHAIEGTMAPLDLSDVDTDQIIPKQFLKRIERTGFGPFAFYDWAHTADGEVSSDFILNRPEYESAKILVTGANFGCGSSREHAPWALLDRGFAAIIAPSFADIFRNNCAKIGLLCVALTEGEVRELTSAAMANPAQVARVDLSNLMVTTDGFESTFEFEPFARECLINGWDEIALTEQLSSEISAYEDQRPTYRPVTSGA